ncbi:MAG: hypothetical protein V1822_02465 [Candidatus Micrarchaeota archaeon]
MTNVPGKILFLGGYSVLERGNPALSIAVFGEGGKGVEARAAIGKRRVRCPQFGLDFEPSLENRELVNIAYLVAQKYLEERGEWRGDVEVELENSPIFGSSDEKSGLGSSAAATVALIRGLFEAQGAEQQVEIVHKLAQYAHAIYQKKIGSGFDIATSAYGRTIEYCRYSPRSFSVSERLEDNLKDVGAIVQEKWDWLEVKPFEIASGYEILFFNVRGGKTSTVSSVRAVRKFMDEEPAAYAKIISAQAEAERQALAALKAGDREKFRDFVHDAREAGRKLQDATSEIASDFTPIEPAALGRVIDEAEGLEGVVAGRCPGAGGWDGLAFLVEKGFSDWESIGAFGTQEGLVLHRVGLEIA